MWFTCLWPVNSWRMQIQGRNLSLCFRGGEEGETGGEGKQNEQMHYHTEAKQEFPEGSPVFYQERSKCF